MWNRAIEKCYRGASYVASYVNNGSKFPDFLKTYFVRNILIQRVLVLGNRFFSSVMYSRSNEVSVIWSRLTEIQSYSSDSQYVIHRYFPKFSGYSRAFLLFVIRQYAKIWKRGDLMNLISSSFVLLMIRNVCFKMYSIE